VARLWRIGSRWIGAAVAVALLGVAPASSQSAEEYQIKAAFLYNFAKFIEWPHSAFTGDTMDLCVLGSETFASTLETVVSDKKLQGKRPAVRRVSRGNETRTCHILFVDHAQEWQVPAILSLLRDAPVLTVGEADGFANRGGVINFLMEHKKVRFEINADAAARAGLQISSQLLKLATNVIPTRSPAN